MKKIIVIIILLQIVSLLSYSQTFNFTNSIHKVGDLLIRGQLFTPDCHISVKEIPFIDSLGKFLSKNTQIIILIEFHTDIRGSEELNKSSTEICGKNRLEKYFNYRYPDITKDRIQYACIGESQPIYSQTDIDKIKDLKEKEFAHSKNRRTIVKIIQIKIEKN
ncbi:MAG: hypothetical protein MUC49_20960 [Raineya sp.]|jgi:hypothetical protein|nr:hypothetical protein [Raineya sp.]